MGSKDLVGVSWPFQTLVVSILCVCESFASKEMLVCTVFTASITCKSRGASIFWDKDIRMVLFVHYQKLEWWSMAEPVRVSLFVALQHKKLILELQTRGKSKSDQVSEPKTVVFCLSFLGPVGFSLVKVGRPKGPMATSSYTGSAAIPTARETRSKGGSEWVVLWVKQCHKPPIWEW